MRLLSTLSFCIRFYLIKMWRSQDKLALLKRADACLKRRLSFYDALDPKVEAGRSVGASGD